MNQGSNKNPESETEQLTSAISRQTAYVKPKLEQHHNWKVLVGQLGSGGITRIHSLEETIQ